MTDELLKVEGAGNDFVVGLGRWADRLAAEPEVVAALCDRQRGLGGDGCLAVRAIGEGEVEAVYRNADGGPAAFCANGTRCVARLAVDLLGMASPVVVHTGWRPVRAVVDGRRVRLELPPVEPLEELDLETEEGTIPVRRIRVGVPHVLVAATDCPGLGIEWLGPRLRRHPDLGPEGANVDLVHSDGGELRIRSWERGVEAETACCGSGVVAAGLAHLAAVGERQVVVRPRSGARLLVEAPAEVFGGPVGLTGPARIVARVTPGPDLLSEEDSSG